MYQELDVKKYRTSPPPIMSTLTELPRTFLEISTLALSLPALASLPRGDGHPVLVLPGFMAGDESTFVLRHYLNLMGYRALPWKLGRNTGRPELFEDKLVARFKEITQRYDGKVSLIGQSLGGVFARELSRVFSASVKQVITLGSPFSAPETSAVNAFVTRLFELQAGMTAESMKEKLGVGDTSQPPPVPMTAIFSRDDGVVNWRGCMESKLDHKTQNIEVRGSHCGMAFNPTIYYIIRDRLAQHTDQWQGYKSRSPMTVIHT